jgi:anaerobic magnesium-protoporphyrin IX monomethyl ester cyclase
VAGQSRAGVRRTPARARRRQVDDIVWPAWDLLPLEAYIDRHQMHGVNRGRPMPVLGTRGCPYQCTFCSSPQMWTTRWIARDPESLLDEMEHYMARYGADDFHFQDLTAIVDRRWILDFTRAIERRGLRFTWQLPSGTRSEAIDAEVARALFRSGCRNLAYAPESGSDAIRKQVKKRVKIDAMLQSIRSTLAAGLSVSCFFVVGFPDDTDETLGETLALVGELARLGVHDVGVAKFSPYPGSRLFEELRASGRIALDDDYFLGLDAYASGDDAVSFCEALDARALHRWQLRILSRFYLRSGMHYPGRSATNIARVLTSGREETRYAKMIRDVVKTRTEWQQRRLKAAASRWSRSLLG